MSKPVSQMSAEEMMAYIAKLEAEKEARRNVRLVFKVSEKGGVSVYGLGRFPVTLYEEQWTRLLNDADALKAFIEEHKSELSHKGDRDKVAA